MKFETVDDIAVFLRKGSYAEMGAAWDALETIMRERDEANERVEKLRSVLEGSNRNRARERRERDEAVALLKECLDYVDPRDFCDPEIEPVIELRARLDAFLAGGAMEAMADQWGRL